MDRDTLERIVDVAPVRGSREPAGRALEMGELRARFANCAADQTPAGARDAAAIALMAGELAFAAPKPRRSTWTA